MIYSSGGKRKKFIQEAHLIIMSFIIQLTSNFRYGSTFNDAINGGTKKNRTKIFIGFKSMSSAAHQFGSVELWFLNLSFDFWIFLLICTAPACLQKIITNIQNSKFDMSKSMSYRGYKYLTHRIQQPIPKLRIWFPRIF